MSYAQSTLSILVATDLSDGAIEALRSGIALARATGAQLHVVHAHDIPFPRSDRGSDLVSVQREIHEKRSDLNALLERELPADLVPTSARVIEGAAAEIVLREADAVRADLIVLGTHHQHRIADRLIGSTAERVLREATAPCLVANAPLELPVRRAVVPNDLSAASRRALAAAFRWSERLSPDSSTVVTVVHVLAPATEAVAATTEAQIRSGIRNVVDTAARDVASDLRSEVEVLHGPDPAFALLDFARDIDAQLIVMGTNSARVLTRAVLGSVSSAMIRRADLPILLVPSPAPGPGEVQHSEEVVVEGAAKL